MKQRPNPFPQGRQISTALIPGVALDDLKPLECKCGGKTFMTAIQLFYASPIQSVKGMPTLVQHPLGFSCTECKDINNFKTEGIPIFEGQGASPVGVPTTPGSNTPIQ